MKRTTVAEFRMRLATFLRRAEKGERVLIQRRGEVIAELAPPPGSEQLAASLAAEPAAPAYLPHPVEPGTPRRRADKASLLELFDDATARQRARERAAPAERTTERGWTREELYDRGRAR